MPTRVVVSFTEKGEELHIDLHRDCAEPCTEKEFRFAEVLGNSIHESLKDSGAIGDQEVFNPTNLPKFLRQKPN